jgi:transposase
MGRKRASHRKVARRQYDNEFKDEAVKMLFDGHSAQSVVSHLGISSTSVLYRWKSERVKEGGQTATVMERRIQELEEQLRITERERDILKKALSIFSQRM